MHRPTQIKCSDEEEEEENTSNIGIANREKQTQKRTMKNYLAIFVHKFQQIKVAFFSCLVNEKRGNGLLYKLPISFDIRTQKHYQLIEKVRESERATKRFDAKRQRKQKKKKNTKNKKGESIRLFNDLMEHPIRFIYSNRFQSNICVHILLSTINIQQHIQSLMGCIFPPIHLSLCFRFLFFLFFFFFVWIEKSAGPRFPS